MKIQLTVRPLEGEPYDVTTDLWAVVQWERKTRRKLADLANGAGGEDLAILAYYAARRAGIIVPASVDEFAQSLESIEPTGSAAPNPTDAAPTDTP